MKLPNCAYCDRQVTDEAWTSEHVNHVTIRDSDGKTFREVEQMRSTNYYCNKTHMNHFLFGA